MYFDGNLPGNGLVRVAEAGGAPEVVTMRDTTQGEGDHAWPEALPGGRGVVFSVRRALFDLTDWDIAVADLTLAAGVGDRLQPFTREFSK